jgi:hypothetical protein
MTNTNSDIRKKLQELQTNIDIQSGIISIIHNTSNHVAQHKTKINDILDETKDVPKKENTSIKNLRINIKQRSREAQEYSAQIQSELTEIHEKIKIKNENLMKLLQKKK